MWKFLLVGILAAAAGIAAVFSVIYATNFPKSYPTAFEVVKVQKEGDTTTFLQVCYLNHWSSKIKLHNEFLAAPVVTGQVRVYPEDASTSSVTSDPNNKVPTNFTKVAYDISPGKVDGDLKTKKLFVLYQIDKNELVVRQIERITAKDDYELSAMFNQLTVAIEKAENNSTTENHIEAPRQKALIVLQDKKEELFAEFKKKSGKTQVLKYVYNCLPFSETNHLDEEGKENCDYKHFTPDTMKSCLTEIQKLLAASH